MTTATGPREGVWRITRSNVYYQSVRVLDLFSGLLFSLLVIRFGLEFLNANENSGFKRMLDRISDPFIRPFYDLFSTLPDTLGTIMLVYFVALVVFVLVYAAIRALLRVIFAR
jgi:uncharacterized protein YggT (Ycf19 family)